MRLLLPVVLLLAGCRGTFMAQVETGYALAPTVDPVEHSGTLQGHIGGSDIPSVGIGLSARARAFSDGWAFPEVGPHGFFMWDDDENVGVYVRAGVLVGLGGHQGEIMPMFTGQLSPGFVIYPGDSPIGLSASLSAELSGSPTTGYGRFWTGAQVGFVIGGVGED